MAVPSSTVALGVLRVARLAVTGSVPALADRAVQPPGVLRARVVLCIPRVLASRLVVQAVAPALQAAGLDSALRAQASDSVQEWVVVEPD